MRRHAHRILLLAILGLWVAFACTQLSKPFDAWQQLSRISLGERRNQLDAPAYAVAEQVKQVTPPDACILFISYTGPEHVNYYKTRFDYYLYPRRIRIDASTAATAENCPYLAVFRDIPVNLAAEPFRGHWDDGQLAHRLAALEKIYSGDHLEIYRSRP